MLIATDFHLIPYHSIAWIGLAEEHSPGKTQIDLICGDTIWVNIEFPDLSRILGNALNNNVKFLDLNAAEIPF